MLAAKQPLVVPMLLRLSHFKLSSYVVLVISKQKGITLVFKTDPLQNVDINSSFDGIAVIQKFIQGEIEGQLRQMFREDLPGIIHRLSQQWVKAKVEAPYLNKPRPPSAPTGRRMFDTMSAPDLSSHQVPAPLSSNIGIHMLRQQSLGPLSYGRAPSISGRSASIASTNRRPTPSQMKSSPFLNTKSSTSLSPSPSDPDLEDFDPTYGLRPESLPTKSVFTSFGRLFTTPNKGLADLAEDPNEGAGDYDYDDVASSSFDVVDWEDMAPDITPPPTISSDDAEEGQEYETLPAVGGGTITRPRIYHSQSLIQTSTKEPSTPGTPTGPQLLDHPPRSAGLTQSALQSVNAMDQHFYPQTMRRPRSLFDVPTTSAIPLYRPTRTTSTDSMVSHSSSGMTRSVPTPPSTEIPHIGTEDDGADSEGIYLKRPQVHLSTSSSANFDTFHPSSSPSNIRDSISEPDPQIVLRPSLNNSIHQLTTLSHSNHTLSPYTRPLEHFTVRSVPPRVAGLSSSGGAEKQHVKARRKRTYRLGGKKVKVALTSPIPEAEDAPPPRPFPVPPSEFDASDMDRYFRSNDDSLSQSNELNPAHDVRRPLQTSHRPS